MTHTNSRPTWLPVGSSRLDPLMAAQMLEALDSSGLTIMKFSKLHGVGAYRVKYWRHRLNATSKSVEKAEGVSSASFAEVRVEPIELVGAKKDVVDQQTLEATLTSGARIVVQGKWAPEAIRNWLSAIEATR